MLIFVFLSLVSCHLGSLTIVSIPHILLLQLALSVQREKGEMERQRTQRNMEGKVKNRRSHTAGLGCQRLTGREKYKREKKEWIKEL